MRAMRWHLWVPRVSGPLAPCVEGYEQWLSARGHPPGLVQTRRWQLGELSLWLERERLTVGELADPLVRERFAAAQRAAGHRSFVSRLSLRVPVAYLREIGLVSVIELAAKYRMPAVYGISLAVADGGLMAYTADYPTIHARAAVYVDKILKGAKPADLPVEQPTKFELVINLKTAKALGLTIPQSVLLRADQVIE